GISCSPAASGNSVVVGSKDGYLYALDVAGGRLRWKVRMGSAVTASPVIAGGAVFIQGSGIHAVDLQTGRTMWRVPVGGSQRSSPVLDGKVMYAADIQGRVYALA
ncbi:MAG: PQQ-binding-like beta-propeller repeat protein, partial [Terriglobia bacterium]